MEQMKIEPKLERKEDPRKPCPKCKGEMHWCHEDRQSGYTMGEPAKVYRGCFAKGNRHPVENVWICLFCDVIVSC